MASETYQVFKWQITQNTPWYGLTKFDHPPVTVKKSPKLSNLERVQGLMIISHNHLKIPGVEKQGKKITAFPTLRETRFFHSADLFSILLLILLELNTEELAGFMQLVCEYLSYSACRKLSWGLNWRVVGPRSSHWLPVHQKGII